MSHQQRYSILSNEMIRRLFNTNHEEPDAEDVTKIIETFTQELKSSGYGRRDARETVVCGFIGWRRKIARRIQEKTPFYRSGASTQRQRCKKKILEKSSWYREKRKREDDADPKRIHRETGDNRKRKVMHNTKQGDKQKVGEIKTVMFVPYTPGSELARRMREAETNLQEITGYRVKIVERTGTKLEDLLHKADPWQGTPCEREMCMLCMTKQWSGKHMSQDCHRRSLVYETWCETCLERDTEKAKQDADGDRKKLEMLTKKISKHKYIGETNRSFFERGWEHLNDFKNLSIKIHLLKHAVEMHDTEEFNTLKIWHENGEIC